MKLEQTEVKPDLLVGKELELYQMAVEFHKGYAALGGLYRRIFAHVRENSLPPERVDAILEAAGFNRQRASEMRRVCATDDQTAKLYTAKQIGFRVVLEVERNKGKKPGGKRGAGAASQIRQKFFDTLSKGAHKGLLKPVFLSINDWGLLIVNFSSESAASMKSPADVVVNGLNKLEFVKPKGK